MAATVSRVILDSETHGEVPSSSVPKKRIAELDGLRGIAILLVIIQHYLVIPGVSPGSALWYALVCFRLSWSGVELFFVLSGFLIGLLRHASLVWVPLPVASLPAQNRCESPLPVSVV